MKRYVIVALSVLLLGLSLLPVQVTAQEESSKNYGQKLLDNLSSQEHYYGGIGFNRNSLSGYDAAIGFQFYAGWDFPKFINDPNLSTHFEAGFMDSGDFETTDIFGNTQTTSASGLWFSGVEKLRFTDSISGLGRVGFDLGDDDGVLFGVGGEYNLGEKFMLRGEYVIRSNVDSLQFNFAYHL